MNNNTPKTSDRGNVLPLVLVMMVVGSLMVTALLTFALTLLRNRPPLEERSDSLEAVRSAMRMAIVMQRDHGPGGCYETNDPTFVVNGRSVQVQCVPMQALNDNGGRFGVITTSSDGLANGAVPNNESIRTGTGNVPKQVLGSVFVNGGQLGGNNDGLNMVDGQLFGSSYTSASTPAYRYTQIDIDTELTYPVGTFGAGATCSTLFGPDIIEQTFDTGILATSAVFPIESSTDPTGVLRVQRVASTNVIIHGVLVHDDSSTLRLVRRSVGPDWRFEIPGPIVDLGDTAIVCYQDLDDPATTELTPEFTFCGGPLIDPELVQQSAAAGDGITCDPLPWWSYAGWKPNQNTEYIYPMLPQVPTYPRSSTPVAVGDPATADCFVFYPGRYDSPVVLDSGDNYYFASGVYLFNDEFRVEDGTQVVAGEGTYKGCAFDADAAFLPGSPRSHEITGKGATFLLGSDELASSAAVPSDNGRIVVENASLRVNRRVATTSTRASSGISVMSINVASTGSVEIPANDRVLLPSCLASEVRQMDIDAAANGTTNPCAEDIATYSITPTAAIGSVAYTKSGLGPDDVIIEATLDGSTKSSNRVLLDGNVFVPNSRIVMSRSQADTDYAVRLGNGAVASSMLFDFPVGDDTNFLIGQQTETAYQKVKLVTTTTFNGQDFRSVAEVEVDSADRYAINSWTVDAGSGDPLSGVDTPNSGDGNDSTTGGTTTGGSTTGGTTTGGSTTGGSTTGGSTTGGTTTGGTTGGPDGPCDADSAWTAEWFNNTTLSGTPDLVTQETSVNYFWGSSAPKAGINDNNFSVRWTRKIVVPADGFYEYTVGGDDGYRLKIDDGPWIADNWSTHSYQEESGTVELSAGCAHTVVMEFFEQTGTAEARLSYGSTPVQLDCPNDGDAQWRGDYYNDTNYSRDRTDWRRYRFSRFSDEVDFNWGNGSPNRNRLGNDTYSIRFSKTINLESPGLYQFDGGGNNGYRLYVNGQAVFDNWGNPTYQESNGQIQIDDRCGVELVYEFYENVGSASVWLGNPVQIS